MKDKNKVPYEKNAAHFSRQKKRQVHEKVNHVSYMNNTIYPKNFWKTLTFEYTQTIFSFLLMKVLIIEDNLQLATNIVRFLAMHDIVAETAQDGKAWLSKALQNIYDVIVLDLELPELSGLDILKELRAKEKNMQIIILSAYNSKPDIVTGLNLGADDYMTKPFDFEELLARIHSLHRRNLKIKSNHIAFGDGYRLDVEEMTVFHHETEIKLSPLEFQLIKYFAQNPGVVLSRQELYEKVWGKFDGDIMFSKMIDVYVGYLRKKFDAQLIETVKWVWYKFKK